MTDDRNKLFPLGAALPPIDSATHINLTAVLNPPSNPPSPLVLYLES